MYLKVFLRIKIEFVFLLFNGVFCILKKEKSFWKWSVLENFIDLMENR